jgi:hypothetical protein
MVEAYRQAMLANPVLDFDEILCVRRKVAEPRRATYPQQLLGDYDFGFTGLNAHNHMDLHRKGYENDIVLLSGWKTGAATARSLYRPPDTGIVRDLDLDFDASRILFTSYKGTNNLFGVYEITLNDEMVKSPPSAALNGLNGEMVKSRPLGALNGAEPNLMGAKRPFKGGEAADLKGEARLKGRRPIYSTTTFREATWTPNSSPKPLLV